MDEKQIILIIGILLVIGGIAIASQYKEIIDYSYGEPVYCGYEFPHASQGYTIAFVGFIIILIVLIVGITGHEHKSPNVT